MGMKNIVRFTVTHDVDTGCDFGDKLIEVVPEKQTRDWIGSYISAITAYATNPRYISKGIDSVSYFSKDGYVVAMRSYTKNDERLYTESVVNVINSHVKGICYSSFAQGGNVSADKAFRDSINLAVLTALLGENTKLYCIVDDGDSAMALFRSAVYGMNEKILSKNAFVEAISDVPPVFSPVFLCRCISPSDYGMFLNRAEHDSNSIIIDFKGRRQIRYSLSTPTFAQDFLIKLAAKYSFDSVYAAIENAIASSSIHDAPSRRALFNAWAYLCVKNRFRNDGSLLSMTPEEKEELEQLFK